LRYRAEKQTDTQANGGKNRTPVTAVGVSNKESSLLKILQKARM